MKIKKTASLILPTFNEKDNIVPLVLKCREVLSASTAEFEILVVDDDSPDRTWEVAAGLRQTVPELRIIHRIENHGLTASLREGIGLCRYDVIIWMDADFSHPPEKILQMLFMLDEGFDICVNSRYVVGGGEDRVGKGNVLQMSLSLMLNWLIRFVLFTSFADYTSGFVAVRKEVCKKLILRGDYGEYFISFIFDALSHGYKVCELPYFCMPRRCGESKTGGNLLDYFKRGRKYISTTLRCRWRALGR